MENGEKNDRDFDEQLRSELRVRFAPPPFPEGEIEDRIRNSIHSTRGKLAAVGQSGVRPVPPRWYRPLVQVAAALVLFIAGVEYGRRLNPGVAGIGMSGEPLGPAQEISLPLSIQSAGSQYVATLARFSGEASTLSARERRVARAVAFAGLYGATLELLSEAEDDEVLRAVMEMVAVKREDIDDSSMRLDF